MCPRTDFFRIFLFGIFSASGIYVFCQVWEVFAHHLFKYILSFTLFLLSWDFNDTNISSVIVSQVPMDFFSSLFLSTVQIWGFLLFYLPVHWLFLLSPLFSKSIIRVVKLSLLYFSVLKFSFDPYVFYLFAEIFYLFICFKHVLSLCVEAFSWWLH